MKKLNGMDIGIKINYCYHNIISHRVWCGCVSCEHMNTGYSFQTSHCTFPNIPN